MTLTVICMYRILHDLLKIASIAANKKLIKNTKADLPMFISERILSAVSARISSAFFPYIRSLAYKCCL